jgi:formylglycine-generating enzyme required for sulfatase activity
MAAANRLNAEQLPPGRVFRDCPECPEMVAVPAGAFMMGSPESEVGRKEDEGPQHRVTIAKPFAVGKFEVTFAEWDACVADGGCKHRPGDRGWGRGRRPVIDVSWHDAKEYVAWLSRRTGKTYRLLSEAEWEYAARAGTTTRYAFGDTISESQAQYYADRPVEAGSFPANGFGLHDMHGNVWEWVEDTWHHGYQDAPGDGSVWQGGVVSFRVLRGGSWDSFPDFLRSAYRFKGAPPDDRSEIGGFRVARTL